MIFEIKKPTFRSRIHFFLAKLFGKRITSFDLVSGDDLSVEVISKVYKGKIYILDIITGR